MSNDIAPNPPEGFGPVPFGKGFIDRVGPVFFRMGQSGPQFGFRVMPHHCNPAGICHGGMMMSVMDMAIGSNTAYAAKVHAFTPSINFTYDFLKPGEIGDWLESRIDSVHTTKRTGFVSGFLVGPNGPVMRASGICKIPSGDHPRFQIDRLGAFEKK